MLFLVDMAGDSAVASGSRRMRFSVVGSAWFGRTCGGSPFELVPGDLVVLVGSVVNIWQQVVAVVAGEEAVHAWVPSVCFGQEARVDTSNDGHLSLVAVSCDGSEVSFVSDAQLRMLGIRGTFWGLDMVQGFNSYVMLRRLFCLVVVDGVCSKA